MSQQEGLDREKVSNRKISQDRHYPISQRIYMYLLSWMFWGSTRHRINVGNQPTTSSLVTIKLYSTTKLHFHKVLFSESGACFKVYLCLQRQHSSSIGSQKCTSFAYLRRDSFHMIIVYQSTKTYSVATTDSTTQAPIRLNHHSG